MIKDLTPEEAGRWIDAAPQLVQDVVISSQTEATIEEVGKQFGLHIDMVGLLMKMTNYMLIGYISPEDFLHTFHEVGMSEQQSRQILEEIQKKIFAPLHERIMEEDMAEKREVQSAVMVAESHVAKEEPKAIHHELPPIVRKIQVVSPTLSSNEQTSPSVLDQSVKSEAVPEVLHTAPVVPVSVTPPPQSLPKIIIPIPTVPPKTQEKPAPISPLENRPVAEVPKTPPAPVQSYSTDPYREPIE